MNAKHTFKYVQEGSEHYSPIEITFEVPTLEVTLTQMLDNFEGYLKACGFVFDGHLEVVDEETCAVIDEDAHGCCMGDDDKNNPDNCWNS